MSMAYVTVKKSDGTLASGTVNYYGELPSVGATVSNVEVPAGNDPLQSDMVSGCVVSIREW